MSSRIFDFCPVFAAFLYISRFFAFSAEIIVFWLLKMRTNRVTITILYYM